jgi:1-aminocyclopropane-1-carboxylate deaminase/D-cysteine desulfhydrase-like pyridoxal-dependent ACC family enzyme
MIDFQYYQQLLGLQLPSPIQEVKMPLLDNKGIQLFIKREDLIHPEISGNKWRKLKYNLLEAKRQQQKTLLTFGGAYSNHIAATAAAGHYFGFDTVGIIRGEFTHPLNPTLSLATNYGMKLIYLDRNSYRNANRRELATQLYPQAHYFIPEGGTNIFALKGCQEIVEESMNQIQTPDYYVLACGTGGTLAGVIQALNGESKVIGFSALKGDFLVREVQQLLGNQRYDNWSINTEFHFGGYAKSTLPLIQFIHQFYDKHRILLEPIYTSKALFGLLQLIERKEIKENTTILFIHTGGIQSIIGFNQNTKPEQQIKVIGDFQ